MKVTHTIRALSALLVVVALVAPSLTTVAQSPPASPAASVAASPIPSIPASPAPSIPASPLPSGAATMSRADFHDAMRKLWEDHITWTRLFIVSKGTRRKDLPDLKATTARLLANQQDIGDAIKPFYGDAAGEQLTSLLRTHITTAADLVAAAKAGRDKKVRQASRAWYANADEIAAFLSSADPDAWPLDRMEAMMKDHLDLTLAEATAQIEGRYRASIAAYDEVHDQILTMADMLSDGIIARFPDRFTD